MTTRHWTQQERIRIKGLRRRQRRRTIDGASSEQQKTAQGQSSKQRLETSSGNTVEINDDTLTIEGERRRPGNIDGTRFAVRERGKLLLRRRSHMPLPQRDHFAETFPGAPAGEGGSSMVSLSFEGALRARIPHVQLVDEDGDARNAQAQAIVVFYTRGSRDTERRV